jgi:lysine 2,3-aminomutase
MAGHSSGAFKEKLSPFLKEKLALLREKHGPGSALLHKLADQYIVDPREKPEKEEGERNRHYEADMTFEYDGQSLKGIERLYRRTFLVEPTNACAAHCRYCIRGFYDPFNMSEAALVAFAKFAGSPQNRDDIREILITGGDPLMVPKRVNLLIDSLAEHAPNVRYIRIGTRVPLQDPSRVNADVINALRPRSGLRIEVATQINHTVELFEETKESLVKLQDQGVRFYNHIVLLRGVNDTAEELLDVVDACRNLWIETHYLFHGVPMKGMAHLRTTIDEGLALITAITNSGIVSGRAKPQFTMMTDVGKITPYSGVILKRDGQRVLLQSQYSYEERKRWNPNWQLPESVELDSNGLMRVWYLDGPPKNQTSFAHAPARTSLPVLNEEVVQ